MNLLQYVNNIPLLVQNLIDPATSMAATISVTAIIAIQANDWGADHIADWAIYSDEQRAEFTAGFYTLGQARFDNAYGAATASGSPYNPNLETTDGAEYFSDPESPGIERLDGRLGRLPECPRHRSGPVDNHAPQQRARDDAE